MYEQHPAFTAPPSTAILWRYMDFTKFVSLLDKSSLFFCRADKLGDPFEGFWSQANYKTLTQRYPPEVVQGLLQVGHGFDRMRGWHLVNCWHWNEFESDAMWKIYAAQSRGVAIKTDFQSLTGSLVEDSPLFIGKVNYVDYDETIIPEGNTFYAYLHKRHHFEHEREVRAMMLDTDQLSDQFVGRFCQVDLSELVHQIVVSP